MTHLDFGAGEKLWISRRTAQFCAYLYQEERKAEAAEGGGAAAEGAREAEKAAWEEEKEAIPVLCARMLAGHS